MRVSGSQTVDRALDLLGCFSSEEAYWTLTDLSAKVDLTVPTTHRLLKSLVALDFLSIDPATKLYRLGPAVVDLATSLTRRGDLHAEALLVAQRLRRESGETVSLHLLVDDERVCVLELVSRASIRMSSGLGVRYPLHKGAAGKALLACLPIDTVASHLERNTALDERQAATLMEELAVIRAQGWALSDSEVVAGAVAVASTITDRRGLPIAALNVTGPATRWTQQTAADFASEVRQAAQTVADRLGSHSGR